MKKEYECLKDEELVSLAKNNDSDAVDLLIHRYKSMIAAVTRSYFLIGCDSEDLIQEGMIATVKAIYTYNQEYSFKNYLITCVKNRIFSLIKSSNSQKNVPLNNYVPLFGYGKEDTDKNDIIIDTDFGPEEIFINNEAVEEFKKNIKNTLSEFEYKILQLYLNGFSYKYIAEKVNKKEKSIDNAIQRIRKKLSNLSN